MILGSFFTADSHQAESQPESGRQFQLRTVHTKLLDAVLRLRRQRSGSGADGVMIIIVRTTARDVAIHDDGWEDNL